MKNRIKKIIKKIYKFLRLDKFRLYPSVNKNKISHFFKNLNENQINYVLLRWANDVYKEDIDDFDILVSNEDYKKIIKHVKRRRISKKYITVDLYTPYNVKGGISYFVPHIADEILENTIINNIGIKIPDIKRNFLAFTYHLFYHKGYNSGLSSKYHQKTNNNNEQKYINEFYRLAKLNNVDININDVFLEDLEEILETNKWKAPIDVYFRRSKINKYLYDYLTNSIPKEYYNNYNHSVIIFRGLANKNKTIDYFREKVKQLNVDIEKEIVLNLEQGEKIAKTTRGGDWGAITNDRKSDLLPKYIFYLRKNNVHVENHNMIDVIPQGVVCYDWLLQLKKDVRKHFHTKKGGKYFHILHTSDNGLESLFYKEIIESLIL